jgi:hypothetical protein
LNSHSSQQPALITNSNLDRNSVSKKISEELQPWQTIPSTGLKSTFRIWTGQKPEREKMSIGQYGYVVLATDPDGNMIGLHSGN